IMIDLKKTFYNRLSTKYIIYNACNEDPRVDLELMQMNSDSSICMLCSAGCNALHYLLDNPARIDCIDFNPCQIALADIKFTVIKSSNHTDLWHLFSTGIHPRIKSIYREQLRDRLLPISTVFWDSKLNFFRRGWVKKGLYYRSLSGSLPILADWMKKKDKDALVELFQINDLEKQRQIFDRHLLPYLNGKFMRFLVSMMFKTGIPSRQLDMIHADAKQVHRFLLNRVRYVLTELPGFENYFFYQYLFGTYHEECCPEYLKPQNFALFQDRVDRIHLHHTEFSKFLEQSDRPYTHFLLLDHLDWLVHNPQKLLRQWEIILNRSLVGTKILVRSFLAELDWLPEEVRKNVSFTDNIAPIVAKDRVGHYQNTYLLKVVSPL
ncbi:MAG: BtaA family protein, partial [Candidatus Parabeggiatoa sp.]|nr:BtaA family protein [Candidatus Parabeggiatoa sp.]